MLIYIYTFYKIIVRECVNRQIAHVPSITYVFVYMYDQRQNQYCHVKTHNVRVSFKNIITVLTS